MSELLKVENDQLLQNVIKTSEHKELVFAKKTIEFVKLRDLPEQTFKNGLALLFVRIVNLLGIKNPLEKVNIDDIKTLINMRFLNLSLEEIDYAFKLERFGVLTPKTQHYQNFNASYVSEVLTKYKEWLKQTRVNNNLQIAPVEKQKELTQDEKDLIMYQAVLDCFENYKSNGTIIGISSHIYQHLCDINVVSFSDQQKKQKYKVAKDFLYKEAGLNKSYFKKVKDLKFLQKNENTLVIDQAKKMLLEDFFNKLIAKNTHIKQFLK
ncbi:hypothetical protein [Aurantibacter aestuarii]|uniref:Uncharacterized protein n=1 Tax=Aurantibacter aestuarii TaxID=1266046 RepID=A0A2T1NER1_9FLAO|nr:hypothetical protein [Aurantibacter aestuarii]PSG90889.1 hypothetical protein C7H52_06345 [Aurantibacter aestuarii]